MQKNRMAMVMVMAMGNGNLTKKNIGRKKCHIQRERTRFYG